jgi:hypothetical protein
MILSNWLKEKYKEREENKKFTNLYKEVASQIRNLWYCPLCKSPNSIIISNEQNVIHINCRNKSYISCNFHYIIELNNPIIAKHFSYGITMHETVLSPLKKEYSLGEFGSLCSYNDPFIPKEQETTFAKMHDFKEIILTTSEKVLAQYDCLYYDNSNICDYGKWSSIMLTNKQIFILIDKLNDNEDTGKKNGSKNKIKEALFIFKYVKENKIIGGSLAVIASLFGIRNITSDNWLRWLTEQSEIISKIIMDWMPEIQTIIYNNVNNLIIFFCSYIIGISIASLKLGYPDLKPIKRIIDFFKDAPHFRYFIFAALFFWLFPSKSWANTVLKTIGLLGAFFAFIITYKLLLFKIGWYDFTRWLFKIEHLPKHKRYKIIPLKDIVSVDFHPPFLLGSNKIDDPTEKRPSVELYYKDGKEIPRTLIRLITNHNKFVEEVFLMKLSHQLCNYHAMISFVKKVEYYAAQAKSYAVKK